MNVSRHQTLVPTSAVMFPAASGACALLVLCYSEMDVPALGWREGTHLPMAPESEQDSAHSWCLLLGDQSCPGLMVHLVLPDRAAQWGIPTEMAHVLVCQKK